MQVNCNAAANIPQLQMQAPIKILLCQQMPLTLTAPATDTDGTIASYAWVKISGPTAGTIATPSSCYN